MGQSSKIIKVKLPRPVEPEKEGLQPITLAEVIAAVKESGGKVDYEPIKTDMGGMVPVLIYMAASVIYQWLNSGGVTVTAVQSRFPQASRFDARMCYHEQNNKVTTIVLIPRGEEKKAVCTNS